MVLDVVHKTQQTFFYIESQWQLRYIRCNTSFKRRHLKLPSSFDVFLYMVTKKPFSHQFITYSFRKTLMVVNPGAYKITD